LRLTFVEAIKCFFEYLSGKAMAALERALRPVVDNIEKRSRRALN
jgi:hypothetical protein